MKPSPAQRVAARYLVARLLKGKVIDKLWVVRDPTPLSTLEDIFYETTPRKLVNYAIGTGAAKWQKENTTFHDNEQTALADAKKRLAERLARLQ